MFVAAGLSPRSLLGELALLSAFVAVGTNSLGKTAVSPRRFRCQILVDGSNPVWGANLRLLDFTLSD
jgi:hypothetical protein